jgi:hypothetical protein
MSEHILYIGTAEFKVDKLVPCGFLVGSYSSYFWRDEAEEELTVSFDIEDGSIPLQLASRNISVPVAEGTGMLYLPGHSDRDVH